MKPYEDNKDTGLMWLNQMPSHWHTQQSRYLLREANERSARAVEEVQFAVRKERQAHRNVPHQPINFDLVRRPGRLNIREIKLNGLIQRFGDQAVRSYMDHIEQRAASPALKPTENAYSHRPFPPNE